MSTRSASIFQQNIVDVTVQPQPGTNAGAPGTGPGRTVFEDRGPTSDVASSSDSSNNTISIHASDAKVLAACGLIVGVVAMSPTPALMPRLMVGTAVSVAFTGSGGQTPYSFAAIDGALPPGLTLSQGPLSAPVNGALSQTAAGSLSGVTYYVKTTWVTALGETTASPETSQATSANNVLNVAAPANPPAGATGWNVYVSTTSGAETKQNGSSPIALGTAWVEPASGLVSGAALPSTNTSLPAAGTLYGTPSQAGDFDFVIQIADANSKQFDYVFHVEVGLPAS